MGILSLTVGVLLLLYTVFCVVTVVHLSDDSRLLRSCPENEKTPQEARISGREEFRKTTTRLSRLDIRIDPRDRRREDELILTTNFGEQKGRIWLKIGLLKCRSLLHVAERRNQFLRRH